MWNAFCAESNLQSVLSLHSTKCNLLSATHIAWPAKCNLQSTILLVYYTKCNVQSVISKVQSAKCNLRLMSSSPTFWAEEKRIFFVFLLLEKEEEENLFTIFKLSLKGILLPKERRRIFNDSQKTPTKDLQRKRRRRIFFQ